MSENITLPPLGTLFSFADERTCVSFQLSWTLTGGTFSLSTLKGTSPVPGENTAFTLPFGRIGTVKQVGSGVSTGGLVDTISGPALPPAATQPGFVSIVPGALFNPVKANCAYLAENLAKGFSVNWQAYNPILKAFLYRGNVMSGIQQLAQIVLGDVVVNGGVVYVVPPGVAPGSGFSVPMADIVNVKQDIDYSLDYPSILNPALFLANFDPDGDYIYDDVHAQKQGNTKLSIGSPSGSGARDFIEIPDGWMIDGTYEEWEPPPGTDFSNPNTTANNGRYWKVFQSPDNPAMLRGILSFTRLVKDLKLNGSTDNPIKTSFTPFISTFVGSPITAATNPTIGQPAFSGPTFLTFDNDGTQEGIYGFTADDTIVNDAVSGQNVSVINAMTLIPPGGDSGDAALNFYTIQYGLWTFPKVKPTIFGVGDPTNPFNIPPGTNVVNPSQNVLNLAGSAFPYYYNYLQQYKKINSPRLRTSVTCVFRGAIPQPGDSLTVEGVSQTSCGRISSVSLNMSRSGMTLSIQAELYQYGVTETSNFGNNIFAP